ncbi:ABC transporter ATP-binding protein [Microbulbifer sp. 2205BS26-8]|uniref:ABC transporter ATP-binding protein n=1 Tax=Microbulbifer sp. 2205BS26-8 TaxID=3064386 RepID=UPI00273DBFD5|nr:ABC transporter ATP-binding protein [Microbulbifer sp. 2205BS26-8]MDP5210034.1 ABC transporter ATP-binding protein [Microbulbifer sp. 2205BS26-8]
MTAALSIQNLQKTYENGFQALKDISFAVQPGDFFALLGPNGAGKSTIIGIICSLVRKTAGSVSIFGIDTDSNFPAAKRLLGVVPQEFNFSQFEKVSDILMTQGGFYGMPRKLAGERSEKYLKQLDLWDKRGTQARMLSGGMKRRLMIARALIHEPKLLILDEPTAGVDIELRRSMWRFLERINAQGTTIILTTHYLEEAESLCRNIAIIDKGIIVENTSIKSLLKTLNRERFILDCNAYLEKAPVLLEFECRLLDSHSLEVTLEKGQSLTELFAALKTQGVTVTSMRNRANRLEELFLSMLSEEKMEGLDQ